MLDSLFPLLLSSLALGLSAAGLFAFVTRVQTDLAGQASLEAAKPQAISAVWALVIAALLGLVFGNVWPHLAVLAVGGAVFLCRWIREQGPLKWALGVVFFSSVSFNVPSSEKRVPVRFAAEAFGHPIIFLALLLAIGILVVLFRLWPRHTPREIGAAAPRLQRTAVSWRDMALCSLLLLVAAYAASTWPTPRQDDAEFLAAMPLGVTFGIGLSFILLAAARIESAYRALDLRRRENLQLPAMTALGAIFLALLGLEFRFLGPALFIGYTAAAGILIASPSVPLLPPSLSAWLRKAPQRPNSAQSSR